MKLLLCYMFEDNNARLYLFSDCMKTGDLKFSIHDVYYNNISYVLLDVVKSSQRSPSICYETCLLPPGKLRSQNDIDEQMHRKPGHNLSKSPTKNRTRRLGISINLTFRKEKGATEESEKGKGRST
ncbi:Hypothetical predicted protein [Olea europaea subsp. europaea]|uniref:Uncharacterized protein n=1 Tax=Olea europaea subsp. europaea TaxID=158383 RepID=A0A8S0PDP8_OLEEU|nr:Hypothetical predicted protein [Olea europaea subsp. europaea]